MEPFSTLIELLERVFANKEASAILWTLMAITIGLFAYRMSDRIFDWTSQTSKDAGRNDDQIDKLIEIAGSAITTFSVDLTRVLNRLADLEDSNTATLRENNRLLTDMSRQVNTLPDDVYIQLLPALQDFRREVNDLLLDTERRLLASFSNSSVYTKKEGNNDRS